MRLPDVASGRGVAVIPVSFFSDSHWRMEETKMKKWQGMLLAMVMMCSFLTAPAFAAETEKPEAKSEYVEVLTVKQLRGKLLYKRNQIRKYERAAIAEDDTLGYKIAELENKIQALYVAAEPKLEALYAAEKGLLKQIDEASQKK